MKQRRTRFSLIVVGSVATLVVGLGSAWAQIAVTDPATTARNAVVAVLKDHIISGTNQAGVLRVNARREQVAVDALESDVINPSEEQSTTAVLDKISGSTLIEARQKEARLELLTGIVEQLLVDGKRARDAETGLLNMQLNRLRLSDVGEGGEAMLTGAADDLRSWRQP